MEKQLSSLLFFVAGTPRYFFALMFAIRLKFEIRWQVLPVLDILFEEPHFLLINKPSGLFSQSAPGIDNVQEQLVHQIAARDHHPGRPFIGLPHRLDRGTSGVMLLARNQRALKRFGEQFHSRKVAKFYMAVVEGQLPHGRQLLEDYLRKIPDKPIAEIVAADCDGARLAQMRVDALLHCDNHTLAIVELLTGRMHQIRLQLSCRGWPVVGDGAYGSSRPFGPLDPEGRRQCLALHSWRLEFRHPQTAKHCVCTAPIPETWRSLPEPIFTAATGLIEKSQATAGPWPTKS